jgi:peptide/nickel transport system substrate-binding protein
MNFRSWRNIGGVITGAAFFAASIFALASPAGAQQMSAAESAARSIPRSETLILARTPDTTIADFNQMNPYGLGGLGRIRDTLNKTVYEFLFYYNHNDGKIIPWLATGYDYNKEFTEITLHLRKGVEWSDGKPFTADDVKFTLDMVKSNSTLVFSSDMKEWLKEVDVVDPLTVHITLNKPDPRWVFFYLAENSEVNIAIVPKHIWEGQDPAGFSNFDLDKGWPVGTGPFRLVKANEQQLVFDRRDDWWAAKIGFHALPAVQRMIRIPGGDQSAQTRLFASDDIDYGGAILAGDFSAAKARNPALVSWNKTGPVWGTADACSYILGLNTMDPPFDKSAVRLAMNYAIDRNKLITLALEGSTVPMVLPLSSFGGVQQYTKQVQDLIDASGVINPSPQKVVDLMTKAGFKKNDQGMWAGSDGKIIQMTIATTGGRRPLGPPVAQMLHDAGFDAIARHDETGQITNAVRDGTQSAWIDPHCGASQEPFPTFSHFMSKYSAPIGKTTGYRWANSRYENPEYDSILNKMEAMTPSPDDPKYVDLFRQAVKIFLRDMPEIVLTEERWVWTYNTKCWTGWPSAEDPYIAPYDVWGGFMLAVVNLKPSGKC